MLYSCIHMCASRHTRKLTYHESFVVSLVAVVSERSNQLITSQVSTAVGVGELEELLIMRHLSTIALHTSQP